MVKTEWKPEVQGGFWQAVEEGGVELNLADAGSFFLQRIEASPCHVACPAGVDVKGYVGLIAEGKFAEAVDLVRRDCPLPGICGRVCTHPCELNCRRSDLDEPVAIRLLKRFVSDHELAHPVEAEVPARRWEEKVAVIGAGPAGLAAAFDLAHMGYGVTVFESDEDPGGMLVQCIPSFRLPREIIKAEVDHIRNLGVDIRCGVRVGQDISLEEIRAEGHKAIILTVGTQLGKKLDVPGEREFWGVLDCVTFLRMANRGDDLPTGKNLLVVGGGMSAMDAARTAKRVGFENVRVVYRRTQAEMPAVPEEVREAEKEGVEFHFLAAPTRVLGKQGKVAALECNRMQLGEPDESGRRRPEPIRDSRFTLDAEVIVPSISQSADLSLLPDDDSYDVTGWGTLAADEATLATSVDGVFAAGDVVLGPDTVIGAIAQGHRAARSAHAWLRGEPLPIPESTAPVELGILPPHPEKDKRRSAPELDPADRGGFEEVEMGFEERAAIDEARRCLRCGPCEECLTCAGDCLHRVVVMSHTNGTDSPPFFIRVPDGIDKFPLSRDDLPVTLRWKAKEKGRKKAREMDMSIAALVCEVNEKLCRGCGDCLAACAYDAIGIFPAGEDLKTARVDFDKCKGCGCCVAVCPTQAMQPGYFGHEDVLGEIEKLVSRREEVGA